MAERAINPCVVSRQRYLSTAIERIFMTSLVMVSALRSNQTSDQMNCVAQLACRSRPFARVTLLLETSLTWHRAYLPTLASLQHPLSPARVGRGWYCVCRTLHETTLQLAMQIGETGRHPLESDDSLLILRSNLALKDRKVTYPCLSANACQEN
jgi:hypothetical protein